METRKMEFTDVLIREEDGSFHPLIISSWEELDFWSDYLDADCVSMPQCARQWEGDQ
jgi:hypothetical protein